MIKERVDTDHNEFAAADELDWEPEKLSKYLYVKGEISQNFYLILHGKVELTMGRDKLFSEYGSYNVLGTLALREAIYAPDFTAKVTGRCKLLKIKRKDYMRFSRFRD